MPPLIFLSRVNRNKSIEGYNYEHYIILPIMVKYSNKYTYLFNVVYSRFKRLLYLDECLYYHIIKEATEGL